MCLPKAHPAPHRTYLPSLAKESPEVLQILEEIRSKSVSPSDEDTVSDHVHSLVIQHAPSEGVEILKARYDSELSRAMSRISSLGIALGYGAGAVLLIVALVPVTCCTDLPLPSGWL